MQRFRFKFEAVDRVRKTAQDSALRALAEAQRRLQSCQQHKLDLLRQLEESRVRREQLGSGEVALPFVQTETDFIIGTKQRIIQADQAIFRATKVVQKAMRGYLQARRAKRSIELLREKAQQEHRKEVQRHEQKVLDDLYTMRAPLTKKTDSDPGQEGNSA